MMRCTLVLMFLLFSSAASAQLVEIKRPCDDVVAAADVHGAEYVPGVDVNGKAVAPADVKSDVQAVVDPIRIPIEIDILKFLDLDIPDGVVAGVEQDVPVAFFDIHSDGRVSYNGRDISSSVSTSCDQGEQSDVMVEKLLNEPVTQEIKSEALPEVKTPTIKADQKDEQSASEPLPSGEKLEGQYP